MDGIGKLKDMQKSVAKRLSLEDAVPLGEVRYVAGFDVSYFGDNCVVAAVVFDFKTMKAVEKKTIVAKAPMNYIPGLLAFREGPLMCQAYYDLEYEPDVLLIDGHGVAHPERCGVAAFVGAELAKPAIGIAKRLLVGEEQNEDIVIDGEVVGKLVRTKEHAKPVYVSPGNSVSVETAAEMVRCCVIPPHKMPEPVHAAHRLADKQAEREKNGKKVVAE